VIGNVPTAKILIFHSEKNATGAKLKPKRKIKLLRSTPTIIIINKIQESKN
jgi:hypothetical protein